MTTYLIEVDDIFVTSSPLIMTPSLLKISSLEDWEVLDDDRDNVFCGFVGDMVPGEPAQIRKRSKRYYRMFQNLELFSYGTMEYGSYDTH